MAEAARKLAPWEDLLAIPYDGKTYEVVSGELDAAPRPLPGHGLAQALLSGELSPPFQRGRGGPGGWFLMIEPDVRLSPHNIVAPDLVGWRRESIFPSFREPDRLTLLPIGFARCFHPATRDGIA